MEWITDKERKEKEEKEEIERIKQNQEERNVEDEKKKAETEKERRRKEIMESTDPSMDEMGTLSWLERLPGGPVGPMFYEQKRSIRITTRQKLLIDAGILDKNDLYRQKESIENEERRKQEQAEKERRIGQLMLSRDPKLDEEATFRVYDEINDKLPEEERTSGYHHRDHVVHGTVRQSELWHEGALPGSDVRRLIKEADEKSLAEEKTQISFKTIKATMRKILGKEER